MCGYMVTGFLFTGKWSWALSYSPAGLLVTVIKKGTNAHKLNPLLTIIIVHYKTPGLLADCLRSIYARPWGISFEIIIVDNASGDDSRERIMGAFPQVKWIDMGYNAGFAR